MTVEQVQTGGDRNLGYILADEFSGKAALVDPSYDPASLVNLARSKGYFIEAILCTHEHGDHINGNEEAKKLTGAVVFMHETSNCDADVRLKHGQTLPLGGLSVVAMHTPGHTPDAICFYVEGAPGVVFTGDTLFVGKIGGTSGMAAAKYQYKSLHSILAPLPGDTVVYPGHDVGVTPTSTLSREQKENPFLLQPDLDSFVYLKDHWAEYKAEHGIE